MCCLLSWLRGRHLSISWTCSELSPLCFKYGRYRHLATLVVLFIPKSFLIEGGKYSIAQCVSLQVSMATPQISPEIKKCQKPQTPSLDRSKTGKGLNVKDVSLLAELVNSILVFFCGNLPWLWPAWKNNSVKHLFTVGPEYYLSTGNFFSSSSSEQAPNIHCKHYVKNVDQHCKIAKLLFFCQCEAKCIILNLYGDWFW